MHRTTTIPTMFLAFTAAACAGGGADSDTFVVRDSAGIRIVENVTPARGEVDAWALSQQPLVDIGGQEGDPDYELYRVTDAVRLPGGRIVIGNSGTNQIRLYDESGTHLSDVGGQGEGPGEFAFISWVSKYRGDSIAAYDMRLMRVSVFDGDGHFARSIPVRGMEEGGRGEAYGVFDDGSALVGAVTLRPPDDGSDGYRNEEPLYRVSAEGETGGSLHASPGDEMFRYNAGGTAARSLVFFGAPMFGKSTTYALHGNRFFVASNDNYEISVHGPDGAVQSIVRRQHDPIEVTDADVQALKEEQLGDNIPPGMRGPMTDVLDATPIRETMPAYDSVFVDQVGNIWAEVYRRPGETLRQWTVFDTQGVLLGTLPMPDRLVILDVGDNYVLGKWTDELDIEHVQMYELIKPLEQN